MPTMLETFIKHGDLAITFCGNGDVQITRQSDAQSVMLSFTEWRYVILVADLHGWPIAPPNSTLHPAAEEGCTQN